MSEIFSNETKTNHALPITCFMVKHIVAYFCHHPLESYVELLDLYSALSVIYDDLSYHYVDVTEKESRLVA